jgi:uncharacterized NAD(P)/FAD-binding protein YdhS
MTKSSTRHVLIIGGGASGSLLAIHLLRAAPLGLKITLIERSAEAGRGLAYGAAHPHHVLNVRSLNMSAYSEDPDHFAAWLTRQPHPAPGKNETRFVPRLTFGRYLSEELLAAKHAAGGRTDLDIVTGNANDILADPAWVTVLLADGRQIRGDVAVIATGNELPSPATDPWSRDPWDNPDPKDMKRPDPVLLMGSGLTMVDYVQSLLAAGFQGPLVAISRRGLLPQVHGPADLAPVALELPFPPSFMALWRTLRSEVRRAARAGGDWRPVIDGIRPQSHQIWQSLSLNERQRFLRHARPWWDVHRHRMAPEVAHKIHGLIQDGRLIVIAGKVVAVEPSQQPRGGASVSFRRRGQSSISTLHAMKIVDCRGVLSDVWDSANPIVRALLKRDLARSHPLSLGFDVTSSSALVGRDGSASNRLHALGPLTRGEFWETIAVPDIRTQCERLARELAALVPAETTIWERLRTQMS